jgi:hypothetical protein
MSTDESISSDMGLLGQLSIKLSDEIGSLMAQNISQKEKDILEGFLTLLHTNLAICQAINNGLRPEGLDIDKFTFTFADSLKEISGIVQSHPQYKPIS